MSTAVTTGLFTLSGVVIGGCINVAIAIYTERHKSRTELRAAARLVSGELRGFWGELTQVLAAGLWPKSHKTPEWDRWRDQIARSGGRALWTTVEAAYSVSRTNLHRPISDASKGFERALASHAVDIVADAVHRLDRLDGRRQANKRRREFERIFKNMAEAGRKAEERQEGKPEDA